MWQFEKALYRYPTIVGVRADQGHRGTFKNTFKIQPIRWVVERAFGWMTWSRRLSKDYKIKTFYQENICMISNLQILLRRF